jgi:hypothetical protein
MRIGIRSSILEMAQGHVLTISPPAPIEYRKVVMTMFGCDQRGRSDPYVPDKLPPSQERRSAAFKPGMESRTPRLWMHSATWERNSKRFRKCSPMSVSGTRNSSRSRAHVGVSAKGANPPGSIDSSGQSSPLQREYFYFVDVHGRLHLEDDGKEQAIRRQKVYNIATCFKVRVFPPLSSARALRTFVEMREEISHG